MWRNIVKQLVDESIALVRSFNFQAELPDFFTLKQRVIQHELSLAVNEELSTILVLDDELAVKTQFTHLCRERDRVNFGTALHFLSGSETLANALYLNIAKALYPAANFQELFIILVPSVSRKKTVNLVADVGQMYTSAIKRKRVQCVQIEESAIDHPEMSLVALPVTLNAFKKLVCVNDCIFVLDDIENFNFSLHQQLYRQLFTNDKDLLSAIIAHNESIALLYNNIAKLEGHAASLGEVIFPIAQRMSISGSGVNGGDFAIEEGNRAAERLLSYYHQLPDEMRQALDRCETDGGPVFSKVIENIHHNECIEQASSALLSMLAKKKNECIFKLRPHMSAVELEQMMTVYRSRQNLHLLSSLDRTGQLTALPMVRAEIFYAQLAVVSEYALIEHLIQFPPETYILWLAFCKDDMAALDMFSNLMWILDLLSEAQRTAFVSALVELDMRFDDPRILFVALLKTRNVQELKKYLAMLEPDERWALVRLPNLDGLPFLHQLLDDHELLAVVLDYFSVDENLGFLLLSNEDGLSFIRCAFASPAAFEVITCRFLAEKFMTAMQLVDEDHFSVIELAAMVNTHILKRIFERLTPAEKLAVIQKNERSGNNLFHAAARNLSSLIFLLKTFPQAIVLPLIKEADQDGVTVLYLTLTQVACFKMILSLYPESEWLPALHASQPESPTILELSIYQTDIFLFILSLLQPTDRTAYAALYFAKANGVLMNIEQTLLFLAIISGHRPILAFQNLVAEQRSILGLEMAGEVVAEEVPMEAALAPSL